MSAAEPAAATLHGGLLAARRLRAHGTETVFTLSGGHLFSFYDGCRTEGIRLIDTRHEQTAAFAAEGWAKVTREPGVAALTAGPGVTNGMSALASAAMNRSPMVVIGGRAPAFRWGQGSLQEIDHLSFVRPLTRLAATADSTEEIPGLIDRAYAAAVAPPSGPAFVDLPLDHVFGSVAAEGFRDGGLQPGRAPHPEPADGPALERAGALLADAERPVIMAGTGLYWGFGEDQLRSLCERLRIPVFLNGLARGCLPADHELFFSRVRASAFADADVALVVGVPLDFRLGFGDAFGGGCEVVLVESFEPERRPPRAVAAECYGPVAETLSALVALGEPPGGAGPDPSLASSRERWIAGLRSDELARRSAEAAELADERIPLHPMRIYGELATLLDRDAIVVGDGGDFVSYAGRVIDSYQPGCWLDPGPYGCLGSGPGYALAAKLARPERDVVLLLGDGAFGFSGMEWDTLARHGVAVVGVVANNGIWALEKHPMEAIYGYSVVADLAPGTRYDLVAEALGCDGALVERPAELRPALEGALAGGRPAVVNVMTDPAIAYPRRSKLA